MTATLSTTCRVLLVLQLVFQSLAFLEPVRRRQFATSSSRVPSWLGATSVTTTPPRQASRIAELAKQIDACIAAVEDPEELLQQMEAMNTVQEPNRSPSFFGEWHVWYTNCPPPSNRQLGPFKGTAGQVIYNDSTRSYQNLLQVPPNDWLTATLDGIWEEWNGQLLGQNDKCTVDDPGQNDDSTTIDWGANHWKVTFRSLCISLFGFTIFQKEFPPDTARVWRTTFLDDEIRIVRAGKTGRVEDEVVFYTKRTPAPSL